MPKNKIRLGISSCLLGEKVRHDGENKRNHSLIDALDNYVEWVPVCPEVEAGFSVPREAVRLLAPARSPRVVTVTTGIDHTNQILAQIRKIIDALEKQHVCGFVFKSKSPSCGLDNIPIHDVNGTPCGKGMGLFAKVLMKHFPLMLAVEDKQLLTATERKNFLERAFDLSRQLANLQ